LKDIELIESVGGLATSTSFKAGVGNAAVLLGRPKIDILDL
jgi:hypothetical protein